MKKQIEGDIQQCNASFNELRLASQKFMDSKTAIHNFSLQDSEREILVPLTSSLYIPGRIEDVKTVTVELGAGYYADMPTAKAEEYCDWKVKFIQDSVKKVGEIID